MTEETVAFTIENFYKFVKEGKIMGAQCNKCGHVTVPPRPVCPKCLSKHLTWKENPKQGKLLTYTIIHVCPEQFQPLAPYAVGVVELENGAHLPGMIKGIPHEKIKIGMRLTIDFEEAKSEGWPQWPRCYFKP
ncbi:MAG: Zn-ribbon domain-containing OB-fold protein [Candidatus Bathyarchaeia archaeon]|jgi:uncharacterized OB-fold protein|nr:Zn-ribbon domain-containing OB-fold protein [Candidatus Bathyarchaeota archaeon A05DMB-4]MDH7595181.1 Zn-ribbon domain-containing OB-fold protein [Candidatus Bathyarchaeota archaeon]